MYSIESSFEVGVSPDKVFAWLADLENLPRFQSGVFHSEILTPPPTRPGTRFRETFKLMGFVRMVAECEVIEMTEPRVLGFRGTGRQMDYQSRFIIEPSPGRSKDQPRSDHLDAWPMEASRADGEGRGAEGGRRRARSAPDRHRGRPWVG